MLFKILHGDKARISTDITPYHEGYCYVTHDGYFYVDMNNERVKLNSHNAETLTGKSLEEIQKSINYNDLKNKPSALPNPNKIIFTGAVTGEYDGSKAMTLNIPASSEEIYIGDGDMPENATIQIILDGEDEPGGVTDNAISEHNMDITAHTDIREKINQLSSEKADKSELESLITLPYGGSKEWLEANGDKTQLYQIDGYVWGYVEADGWVKSGIQFRVVHSESQMTDTNGVPYLLRSGDTGTVYAYAETGGDTNVTIVESIPDIAEEGDIIVIKPTEVDSIAKMTDLNKQYAFNGKVYKGKEVAGKTNIQILDTLNYFKGHMSGTGISSSTNYIFRLPIDISKIPASADVWVNVEGLYRMDTTSPFLQKVGYSTFDEPIVGTSQTIGSAYATSDYCIDTERGCKIHVGYIDGAKVSNYDNIKTMLLEITAAEYDKIGLDSSIGVYLQYDTTLLEWEDTGYYTDKKYKASLTNKVVPAYTDFKNTTLDENDTFAWKIGKRLNSSGGLSDGDAGEGVEVTNLFPCKMGDIVRVKCPMSLTRASWYYNASKATLGMIYPLSDLAGNYQYDEVNGIATFKAGYYTSEDGSDAHSEMAFMRITLKGITDANRNDVVITVNEEITTKTVSVVTWNEYGAYVPPVEGGWYAKSETYSVVDSLLYTPINTVPVVYSGDGYVYSYIVGSDWMQMSKYEPLKLTIDDMLSDTSTNAIQNRVVKAAIDYIESKAIRNANDIVTLRNDMEALGGGTTSEVVTIPSYWNDMVSAKTATAKALQEVGGKNCVSFAWASDTHIPDNDNGRTTDLGKVMAKMLDNCEAPFAVITGDINTRASFSTEEGLLTAQAEMPIHLAPLWATDRLLMSLGNHDGCYGDSTGYYRKQFTPEKMWQTFFRGQALDFRRVFSDNGLYFYVDNIVQKTRFIMLNSQFEGEYAEDTNGFAVNNRFGTSCYGQAQLNWLSDVALDMPEGYCAILFAHVPPNITYTVDKAQLIGIVNAYNNKTTFSGSYTAGVVGWTNSTVDVNFTKANGEIIAMFAGHVHGDSIDTTTMTCPILTILSAGASANDPYKETAPTRTSGTDMETSFDMVTINKSTKTIYCTRIGAGADREVSY